MLGLTTRFAGGPQPETTYPADVRGPLAAKGPAAAAGGVLVAAAVAGMMGLLFEAVAINFGAAGFALFAPEELMTVPVATASCCPVAG